MLVFKLHYIKMCMWVYIHYELMSTSTDLSQPNTYYYHILPIEGASPNKGAPHSLGGGKSIINDQNTHIFLNNYPIFYPKPPLESLEPQLFTHNIRCDLANSPGSLIRQNTVYIWESQMRTLPGMHQLWGHLFTKAQFMSIITTTLDNLTVSSTIYRECCAFIYFYKVFNIIDAYHYIV